MAGVDGAAQVLAVLLDDVPALDGVGAVPELERVSPLGLAVDAHGGAGAHGVVGGAVAQVQGGAGRRLVPRLRPRRVCGAARPAPVLPGRPSRDGHYPRLVGLGAAAGVADRLGAQVGQRSGPGAVDSLGVDRLDRHAGAPGGRGETAAGLAAAREVDGEVRLLFADHPAGDGLRLVGVVEPVPVAVDAAQSRPGRGDG